MIPTIYGRHAWTPPGAGAVAATLNYLKDDAGVQVYPRVRLTKGTALRTLGDPESNADPRIGGPGEHPRRSYRRGRPMTYAGFVEARTLASFEAYAEILANAFADESAEGRMDITWHPLYHAAGPHRAAFAEARSLGLEIGEPVEATALFKATFVLALRNHDGRYFSAGSTAAAAIAATNTLYTFA